MRCDDAKTEQGIGIKNVDKAIHSIVNCIMENRLAKLYCYSADQGAECLQPHFASRRLGICTRPLSLVVVQVRVELGLCFLTSIL